MSAVRRVNGYLKRWVAAQAAWKCTACQEMVDHLYEIDHIVPLHRGGSNEPRNLQLLCYGCHRSKTWMELALGLRPDERACPVCRHVYSVHFAHICDGPKL